MDLITEPQAWSFYSDPKYSGMWIFWIIIFLVVILVIKLLMSADNKQISPSSETPIEILKRRYANGDIDEEEFDRRRKTLEQ